MEAGSSHAIAAENNMLQLIMCLGKAVYASWNGSVPAL